VLVPAKASLPRAVSALAVTTSTHYLRILTPVFRELAQGRQHALCLSKDEGVLVGDQLVLREFRETDASGKGTYTGVWLMRRVTAELVGEGIADTHAVYSLNTAAENERAIVVVKRQLGLAEAQGVTMERFFRHQERKERARRDVLRRSSERVSRVRSASAEAAAAADDRSEAAG